MMEHTDLGGGALRVSRVCLGTMTFGQQTGRADAHAQLDCARAHGINFIDTAEMYAVPPCAATYGATESIVGEWLARQPRDQIVLASKVAGPARSLEWIRGGPPALDASNIRAALEGSLKRLRTDYLDLYQLHWPERNQPMFGQWQYEPAKERDCTPILAQLEVLGRLCEEGKIRHVGLSNEHPWGVMEFVRLAGEHGLPRVVSIQNAYNLLNRVFEYGLAEVCHREQVGLLAYSPLAFGHLSGKYLLNPQASGRLTEFANFGQRYAKPGVPAAVQAYVAIARRRGLSPAAMALAYVYRRECVASTIIGASTLAQLEENLAAWQLELDHDTLAEIEEVHLRNANPAP
jgi:aryl-alcohol dehydrogenase-like predicted oxidoreductase